ncbi:MAG: hypothetical protein QG574_2654 [Cyanobacteriota bacterium erpe_2018_sw_21hr_WHONDRS-SW48-000092_B_bin.40]|jgi:hypothetical protein|nr:hypothetical protein [Cyanobacteriota bacterium erpe_2018_sw_21hr_WHONDRS-SW48-000092_B_bin.40]
MKEVSNYQQASDSMAAVIDNHDSAANNMAAEAWSGRSSSFDRQENPLHNVKCLVITDPYGEVSKKCFAAPPDMPGVPSSLEPVGKPPLKPEIPANGGLKDPIKNESLDGGIKKPTKPQVEDSIEFGEPFVKPAGKPGKIIKSSAN